MAGFMDRLRGATTGLIGNAIGNAEVGLALGSGIASDVPAGYAGLLGSATGGMDRGADWVRGTQDALQYTPRTQAAKTKLAELGYVIDAGGKLVKQAAERAPQPVKDLAGAASQGWYDTSAKYPALAAIGFGAINTLGPGGRGKRAARALDDVAEVPSLLRPQADGGPAITAAERQEILDQPGGPSLLRPQADGGPLDPQGGTASPSPFGLDSADLTQDPGRTRGIKRYFGRETPEYARDLMANEGAYQKVLGWARGGMTEDGIGWYNTEPLRREFISELGEDEGQRAYEQYIDLVAATSAGAKTPANAKIAGYYYYNARQGKPAEKPAKGSGYGHKAQNLHFNSARDILEGGGLDDVDNPKRTTFAENLKGNWKYATVDKHNVRALGMASGDPRWIATRFDDPRVAPKPAWWDDAKLGEFDKSGSPQEMAQRAISAGAAQWDDIPATWFRGAPSKTDYAAMERINLRLAKDLGVAPAQAQAALWLGAGNVTGLGSPPKAFMKIMDDRIRATAKRDGISNEQARRDFIRGNRMLGFAKPGLLAGIGGAGLLGAWAMSGGDSEEAAVEKEEKRRTRSQRELEEMGE